MMRRHLPRLSIPDESFLFFVDDDINNTIRSGGGGGGGDADSTLVANGGDTSDSFVFKVKFLYYVNVDIRCDVGSVRTRMATHM